MTAKGSRKPEQHKVMTKQEVAALLYAAHTTNPMAYFLFACQYLLGLRIGEVILLRYEHMGSVVNGVPMSVNVPTLKKRDRSSFPKCPASGVPLYPTPVLSHPGVVAAAFSKTYRRGPARESPWLFPGKDPTRHLSRSRAFEWWGAIRDEAGLPDWYSPHSLRHSASTHLYAKAGRMRAVSRFLRHEDSGGRDEDGARVTARYVHLTQQDWLRLRGALDLPPLAPLPLRARLL